MVTNQLMQRPLGQFQVLQRTKDGMFNATALINQWNEANGTKKELKDFLRNQNTEEFIQAIYEEEFLHRENSPYVKPIENQGVVNTQKIGDLKKGIIEVSKARLDRGGGTWMHPLLFIDFAMWLNPTFKVKVLKFVHDKMIDFRNKSGDYAVKLSKAVQSICGEHDNMGHLMSRVHNGINYTIFGHTGELTRNQYGTQEKMEELWLYEKHLTDLINDGFIKNSSQLIKYMGKKWKEKNQLPDCFVEAKEIA